MTGKTSSRANRAALIAGIIDATRKGSAQGVLFGEGVATRVGANASDLECLDLVVLGTDVTPGQLAQATGLTTGAVTGVIDRLEAGGFVTRERDTEDRRKIYVRAVPARVRRLFEFYAPMQQAFEDLLRDYSDEQLALLLDFSTRGHRMMVEQTARLRATPGGGRRKGARSSGGGKTGSKE